MFSKSSSKVTALKLPTLSMTLSVVLRKTLHLAIAKASPLKDTLPSTTSVIS